MMEVVYTFDSYEFTFAGHSCLEYGLMICDIGSTKNKDVSFANKATIVESKTVKSIQPIHYGVKYHESPLEFKIIFGADEPIDRHRFEEIALWLTGYQDYQWLTINQSDLDHIMYKCLITNLTPITVGWVPYAFEATVRCDCPYAYSLPFERTYIIDGTLDIVFHNESSVRDYLTPNITIIPNEGISEIKITNHSDDERELVFTNLPTGNIKIHMDNKNKIITEDVFGYNLYDNFNSNFFRLVQGENKISIDGSCTLVISGQFLRNVSA